MACRIAIGGSYWKKDESSSIPYRTKKGELKHKPGSKLVQGDKPYTPIEIKPHEYRMAQSGKFAGLALETPLHWDNMTILNSLRQDQIKKQYGEESLQYLEEKQKLEEIEATIWQDSRRRKHETSVSVGIDPGVVSVIATDHGALFRPNLSRDENGCRRSQLG
ncbi:hypothetical protein ACN4EG_21180 [Alkalinema pantanalense CENA528]|uniref:hypothetical protein n=1 Tax=Alkalinema pantanalense TaxID=1620705 RepID=UPI003D6E06A2